ncbi:hypothetical protein [Streptomyces nogalater]|uniref:Uncharacterized protein n=1 Tax=Streptomyces nogalater TaxID=38314 RepID=A0ABW0WBY2_STRNO
MRHSAEGGEGPIEEQPGLRDEDPAVPEDEVYEETAAPDDEVYDDMPGPDGKPAGRRRAADAEPDVFLDVPVLKVDQIDLDVEDLRAHVSLQAEVLDLLRLNVGADVALGRVHLGISGVEAQARLEVRLDNVAMIINRVLTTLDRNPQILEELTRGVGSAVRDVGSGARQAVGELGTGASRAVGDLGSGAGSAVRDVGRGAGSAVEGVGRGAGDAVGEVTRGVGGTVADAASGVTRAVEDVPAAVEDVPEVADVADVAGDVPDVTDARDAAGGAVRRTAAPGGPRTREPGGEYRDPTVRSRGGTRARRLRGEDGKVPPRPVRRRAPRERDEPP